MNQIRLHVSLIRWAEWMFSSLILVSLQCPNMKTSCLSPVLSRRSGGNNSSLSPHQHCPVVFDTSNQPTGGLDTNHPWIHSHPAWRHISAMADATYRAPSALHFISFLNLLSCSLRKKKKTSFLFSELTQCSVHSIYSWKNHFTLRRCYRASSLKRPTRSKFHSSHLKMATLPYPSRTYATQGPWRLDMWGRFSDLVTLLPSWVSQFLQHRWAQMELKVLGIISTHHLFTVWQLLAALSKLHLRAVTALPSLSCTQTERKCLQFWHKTALNKEACSMYSCSMLTIPYYSFNI